VKVRVPKVPAQGTHPGPDRSKSARRGFTEVP
jgi:hypothetical protein